MNKFARSRRAVWGDIRFLIGMALIAISIGGVWLVLSSSGSTTPVLQANRTVVRGETLESADFQVVEVSLGSVTDRYLAPQDLRPGQVASRTVVEGELLSSVAAQDAAESRTTTIIVESSTGVPADVAAGRAVELWHTPLGEDGRSLDEPRILVAAATVASVTKTEGMLATGGTAVEVVVDRADVAALLAAITGGSVLSVVPIGPSA